MTIRIERLLSLVALSLGLILGLSVAQLRANVRLSSAFFSCVDHGCKTDADCTKLQCDVCAGDQHCGLVP